MLIKKISLGHWDKSRGQKLPNCDPKTSFCHLNCYWNFPKFWCYKHIFTDVLSVLSQIVSDFLGCKGSRIAKSTLFQVISCYFETLWYHNISYNSIKIIIKNMIYFFTNCFQLGTQAKFGHLKRLPT
jgi:hypothetical protein